MNIQYHSNAYKDLSLYEWARLSVKTKIKNKKHDSTLLEFLPGHSQRKTHKLKCIPS